MSIRRRPMTDEEADYLNDCFRDEREDWWARLVEEYMDRSEQEADWKRLENAAKPRAALRRKADRR